MVAKRAILVQDNAPCHKAASVQKFLENYFPRFLRSQAWPPNSSDLNVLDYFGWDALQERIDKYGMIPNFNKLKEILKKEWKLIPQDGFRASVDSWLTRVRRVEKAHGENI